MAKKNNSPTITHTEVLSYAISWVRQQYLEADKQASAFEAVGNIEMAEKVRETLGMKSKLIALGKLYEIETGSDGLDIDI